MMKNYDESVETNHNANWSYISDHPSRILIIGGIKKNCVKNCVIEL